MAIYTTLDATPAPVADVFRLPAALSEPTVASALAEPIVASKSLEFSPMAVGAIIALAGLDLVGSYCAMRYMDNGHQLWWSAGAIAFLGLFAVYAASLQWAELGTVTLGWIVFLQVGVLIMDKMANGVVVPAGKWAAMAAIFALMTYMILAPNGKSTKSASIAPSPSAGPSGAVGGTAVIGERTANR
ncbi:hypothetical protein [Cryptosporangium aurantiacum]|uniref:Uncharacterized protein n=1 Tax=Cryptosporangium aurantiacum TaxID=134849 RepID=A0A1M7RIJ2_9ACTN|nr:hypothetical protein [Cryptosporangium aurantiacum]SHN45979.1 hypothetical protein SAMN05443668_113115 [Cryptosporangium aurantiacum]